MIEIVRRILNREGPAAYPFGTILQHRRLDYRTMAYPLSSPDMRTLKAMVLGRATYGHPQQIKVIDLNGMLCGRVVDVYLDSWEVDPKAN